MSWVRYLGLILGLGWGLFIVLGTASSERSAIVGEGIFVLMATLFPLVAIAPIHVALGARDRPWPLLYSLALTALFVGTLVAYRNVFGSDGPQLGTPLASTALVFLARLRVVPPARRGRGPRAGVPRPAGLATTRPPRAWPGPSSSATVRLPATMRPECSSGRAGRSSRTSASRASTMVQVLPRLRRAATPYTWPGGAGVGRSRSTEVPGFTRKATATPSR